MVWSKADRFEYLRLVHARYNWLSVEGVCSDGPLVFDLEHLYVSPCAPEPLGPKEVDQRSAKTRIAWTGRTPVRLPKDPTQPPTFVGQGPSPSRLAGLLRDLPLLAISAEPGMGKSTFIAWLASTLSRGVAREDGEGLGQRLGLSVLRPIPCVISGHSLLNWAREREATSFSKSRLIDAISEFLRERYGPVAPRARQLRSLAGEGRLLVLFDGLDQVDDLGLQRVFLRSVRDLCAEFPKLRMVVTLRSSVFGRSATTLLDAGFSATRIFPFDTPDVWAFAKRWVSSLYFGQGSPPEAKLIDRTRALYRALIYNHIMGELTGCPLLVVAACVVVHQCRVLPQTAERLCGVMWSTLSSMICHVGPREDNEALVVPKCVLSNFLTAMAQRMRKRPGTVDRAGAVHWLTQRLRFRYGDSARVAACFAVEELLCSCVIVPADEDRLAFCHEAFQDYFKDLLP